MSCSAIDRLSFRDCTKEGVHNVGRHVPHFMIEVANGVLAAIYQGPWFSFDSGRMKRDLTYEIEHQDFLRMKTTRCHRLEQLLILYINSGRSRRTTVVDYQTIEVRDDHLYVFIPNITTSVVANNCSCYVITDRKTPWHLPLKDQFMLITKLVITYVTKSKCKLSIWTAVEWSINPKFSKGVLFFGTT